MDVKLLADEYMPKRAHTFDAGADLFSAENITLAPSSRITVKTGVAVNIIPGFVGLLFSRSGMGKQGVRLSNSVGVIDSGYQGEIGVMLTNDSLFNSFEIKKGDRIAQLVIIPCITPTFRMVNEFTNISARGENGFGSTG